MKTGTWILVGVGALVVLYVVGSILVAPAVAKAAAVPPENEDPTHAGTGAMGRKSGLVPGDQSRYL